MTTNALDLPPVVELIIGLLVGGIMAALFSFIIGLPVLRLKGDYLAIVTLGFGEKIGNKIQRFAFKHAEEETDRATFQAMEALIHNLNTLSR